MKRTLLGLLVMMLFMMTGCDQNMTLENTDLSHISVDGFQIHDPIATVDLSAYTPSETYGGKYRYRYKELVLDTDNETIIYIFLPMLDYGSSLQVKGESPVTIEDVEQILGTDYTSSKWDSEQRLESRIYQDVPHNIKANFIYSYVEGSHNELVFSYLTRLRNSDQTTKGTYQKLSF